MMILFFIFYICNVFAGTSKDMNKIPTYQMNEQSTSSYQSNSCGCSTCLNPCYKYENDLASVAL